MAKKRMLFTGKRSRLGGATEVETWRRSVMKLLCPGFAARQKQRYRDINPLRVPSVGK
jgi:hypothetical protein